jgi:small GTP-binding protein
MKNQNFICKIVVAGDGGVGKTTLIRKLIGKDSATTLTRGVEIEDMLVNINNGITVHTVFWDLGGQPHFRFFQESFFIGANIILLVFDLNRYPSFHHIKEEWLSIIERNRTFQLSIEILIGNKLDLGQTIDDATIHQFADQRKIPYLRVSAKDSINFDKLEELLKREIYNVCNGIQSRSIKLKMT